MPIYVVDFCTLYYKWHTQEAEKRNLTNGSGRLTAQNNISANEKS